jgi:hypothetical protein
MNAEVIELPKFSTSPHIVLHKQSSQVLSFNEDSSQEDCDNMNKNSSYALATVQDQSFKLNNNYSNVSIAEDCKL